MGLQVAYRGDYIRALSRPVSTFYIDVIRLSASTLITFFLVAKRIIHWTPVRRVGGLRRNLMFSKSSKSVDYIAPGSRLLKLPKDSK